MPQFQTSVIPGESKHFWRDPWFDKLTTLSEVEGESSKLVDKQTILDPPPPSAGDDEFREGPVRD